MSSSNNGVGLMSVQGGPGSAATNPLYMAPGAPTGSTFYVTGIVDAAGVVAANNFLSIFNPSGSGKTIVFYSVDLKAYAIATTSGESSMKVFRTTAASGGTLKAAGDIHKILTASGNSIAEVRTGNPSVTLGVNGVYLFSWPPSVTASSGGTVASNAVAPAPGFVCLPGEGIVFSTSGGDTDMRWGIDVTWAEV